MRVVGGSARGRRLVAPQGAHTRPTTDRVREAVMSALWSRGLIEQADVLDLFAGSGALGIEALSRGAAQATFVDHDRQARRAITLNLQACGFTDRATVVAESVDRFLARQDVMATGVQFDLVFCDPPYEFAGWVDLLPRLPAAFVVMEASGEVEVPAGWELVRSVRYGATWVGFAERNAGSIAG